MIWLFILFLILIIAPEVITLLGVMIVLVIVGVFELLTHIFGVEQDKDDKEKKED